MALPEHRHVLRFAGTEAVKPSSYDNPPYSINSQGIQEPIAQKTLPMTATYADGGIHYNRHNLYGLEESMASAAAMSHILGERPFLLTR